MFKKSLVLAVASAAFVVVGPAAVASDCAPGVVCVPPPCHTKTCANYKVHHGNKDSQWNRLLNKLKKDSQWNRFTL